MGAGVNLVKFDSRQAAKTAKASKPLSQFHPQGPTNG